MIQKSTLNGSHGFSIVGVIVGKAMEDNNVLGGMTFVLMVIGVSDTSTLAQDVRSSSRKRFSIRFIEIHYGVHQLAGQQGSKLPDSTSNSSPFLHYLADFFFKFFCFCI